MEKRKSSSSNSSKCMKKRISRRRAIKAGGIAAVGLVFSKPVIETIRPKPAFANYGVQPSSPSEKHGWRALGGMMGPVQ